MGSMIHVGLSVRTLAAPAATDSSPMKLQEHRRVVTATRCGRAGVRVGLRTCERGTSL